MERVLSVGDFKAGILKNERKRADDRRIRSKRRIYKSFEIHKICQSNTVYLRNIHFDNGYVFKSFYTDAIALFSFLFGEYHR